MIRSDCKSFYLCRCAFAVFHHFLWCLGGALCWPFRLKPNHAFPTLIRFALSHVAVFFFVRVLHICHVVVVARCYGHWVTFKSLVTLPELNACSVALMPRRHVFSTHLEADRCCFQEKSQSCTWIWRCTLAFFVWLLELLLIFSNFCSSFPPFFPSV